MDIRLKEKLRAEYHLDNKIIDGIPVFLNDKFVTGDNQKYMKMYDWMSKGYDLAETIVGRLKYGNAINNMRSEIISKLEWRDNCSVLYVSIGTGKDLQFIPELINKKTLDIVGADISLGMLKKCKKKYKTQLNLSLINCCAEDLPFKDNEFDIVFHVGGINFFNDKALAIQEMIRVAKKDSKILIADETADFIEKQYKKSSLSRKYFQGESFDFKDIESAIPSGVADLKTELMWKNKFYCITFKK
ncbi:Methyltransferase domain protein [Flavobacterium psychrophilum]|uniref:class I SAM-dependent methyltransferase n=1 Tax=Flavobacterium psychrophilum TaxID=96345 RepID=UPI000B7C3383|nr:methyltransferase domain-containing protein [Flavobacterium psychrophilum]GEJ39652.1 SAM-dependent methyltransferase [Flavobacterium psychrophilum]GEJ50377.1 SAM-dependent methyltransferase [Flavobacterium psychrophilum]SNB10111.1 Methyltransferase domain protein [Flavobacterium psychrophilum]